MSASHPHSVIRPTRMMIKKSTFNRIRGIVYDSSGITLSERKEALVCARVSKRVRILGLGDYESYLDYLHENPDEMVGLLDSISTNVTSFFREPHHFDFMADELARWYDDGQRRFRIWSAACSTGEEPYSLAMVAREAMPSSDTDVKILATDISTEALDVCERATYGFKHLVPVPTDFRKRWFTETSHGGESAWQVKQELQRMVTFRRMNLAAPPFPMQGPLDLVFCRNVMIYFDDPVRTRLLHDIGRLLRPGGYLVVGHAESLAGMLSSFHYVAPSIYRKD